MLTLGRLKIAASVLVIDSLLLMIIGSAMWHEAPSPADAAVGKALVTLAAVLAVPTLVVVWAFGRAYFEWRATRMRPTRSDWETV